MGNASGMSTARHRCLVCRRAWALLIASLLLFSGIANAYCSIDEQLPNAGLNAAQVSGGPIAPDPGAQDGACPGVPDPAQEDAKLGAQWDGVLGTPIISGHAVYSKPLPVIAVALRPSVAESVFQRVPRLLI